MKYTQKYKEVRLLGHNALKLVENENTFRRNTSPLSSVFSETSADIQLSTRRYTPEDGSLHNPRREKFYSYNVLAVDYRNSKLCEV
jgi:hypothetical protein